MRNAVISSLRIAVDPNHLQSQCFNISACNANVAFFADPIVKNSSNGLDHLFAFSAALTVSIFVKKRSLSSSCSDAAKLIKMPNAMLMQFF